MSSAGGLVGRLRRAMVRTFVISLVVAGALETALSYQALRSRVNELLKAESSLATVQVGEFMHSIISSLAWINDFDPPGASLDLAAARTEAYRVLRREDAVLRLRYFDARGCQLFNVSRFEEDEANPCAADGHIGAAPAIVAAASANGIAFGRVYFSDSSEPHIDVAVASRSRHPGVLVAEIELKQIHDTIAAIRVGQDGGAYIVDSAGRLIAHQDEELVLRNVDVRALPQIQRLVEADGEGSPREAEPVIGINMAGVRVLSGARRIPGLDWWVVVEDPLGDAFAPVFATLWATGAVVALAVVAALLLSGSLARHMARPILALRAGAQRIGEGDLAARMDIRTGDEVEALADEFNRMAATLEQSYASLEARVKARTRELAEAGDQLRIQAQELQAVNQELTRKIAELQERKEEAERANAAKTRFIAVASHDLRQPMHTIGLLVGILGTRIVYPEVRAIVSKVLASVRSMESLFTRLLDITRLDAGSVNPVIKTVELQELFNSLETELVPLALKKGIRLRVVPTRLHVRSDPVLLRQILVNLASNAVRYTPSGKILIGCRRRAQQVEIWVCDTGIGIAEEHFGNIFEEFFQVAQRAGSESGLGLGLSIVRRTAQLLDHSIAVRSVPGRGSIFSLGVGLPDGHGVSDARSLDDPVTNEVIRGSFVLVIDDDPDSRFAASESFRLWDCHVISVADLDEALAELSAHLRTPDLIVCDYRLSNARLGTDAIISLREHLEACVPAIIVTADLATGEIDRLELRLCAVLHKPLNLARLHAFASSLMARDGAVES